MSLDHCTVHHEAYLINLQRIMEDNTILESFDKGQYDEVMSELRTRDESTRKLLISVRNIVNIVFSPRHLCTM